MCSFFLGDIVTDFALVKRKADQVRAPSRATLPLGRASARATRVGFHAL